MEAHSLQNKSTANLLTWQSLKTTHAKLQNASLSFEAIWNLRLQILKGTSVWLYFFKHGLNILENLGLLSVTSLP